MKIKATKTQQPAEAQTKLKLGRAGGKTVATVVVAVEGQAAVAAPPYVLEDCDELTATEKKALANVWAKLEARALAELGLAVVADDAA